MAFAESAARWLLVLHAVLGVAVVASTTHLVLWLRGQNRAKRRTVAATRRFSLISLALYALTFLLGNVLYPTYKVGVRGQYLEDGAAVTREWESRAGARRRLIERYRETRNLYDGTPSSSISPVGEPEEPPELARTTAVVARWFDVKEHFVALGLIMSLAVFLILRRWNPARDSQAIRFAVLGMAISAATAAWLAGIVGLVVSSFRAVAPL